MDDIFGIPQQYQYVPPPPPPPPPPPDPNDINEFRSVLDEPQPQGGPAVNT